VGCSRLVTQEVDHVDEFVGWVGGVESVESFVRESAVVLSRHCDGV
jgi:hypothetical protein